MVWICNLQFLKVFKALKGIPWYSFNTGILKRPEEENVKKECTKEYISCILHRAMLDLLFKRFALFSK